MSPKKLAFWYVLFLVAPATLLALAMGRETLLTEAAKVKPYAVVFQNAEKLGADRPAGERLILFFGDSSVAQPPWAGMDTPHIPQFLEAQLAGAYPELGRISVVEWAFNGARSFHYFCLLFAAEEYRPDLIIIPINWRNLGPGAWEEDERYSFRELSLLVPLRERDHPVASRMLAREGITQTAHALARLCRPLLYLHGLRAWGRDRLGISQPNPAEDLRGKLPSVGALMAGFSDDKLLNTFYATDLGEKNEQLDALGALSQTAERHGLKTLFYITPIHLEEMRRRKGFDHEVFRESVRSLDLAVCADAGSCINLVGLLGEDKFLDCFEHYTWEGNELVARMLAREVARLLGQHTPASISSSSAPGRDNKSGLMQSRCSSPQQGIAPRVSLCDSLSLKPEINALGQSDQDESAEGKMPVRIYN
jgi:hypothetical protein